MPKESNAVLGSATNTMTGSTSELAAFLVQDKGVLDPLKAKQKPEPDAALSADTEPAPDQNQQQADGGEVVLSQDKDDAPKLESEEDGQPEEQPQEQPEAEQKPEEQPQPEEDAAKLEYPKFKKRVDQLTAQRKQAEAEAERLRVEIEELKAKSQEPVIVPAATPKNPFLNLQTLDQVQQQMRVAEELLEWCERHPNGGTMKNSDGTETEYDSDQVVDVKIGVARALRRELPAQAQYLVNKQVADREAEKLYPWYKDRSSREFQMAAEIEKAFPEMRKFWDYRIYLGDMVEGQKARLTRLQSAKKPVPAAKAPAQPTRPAPAPVPKDKQAEARQKAMGRVFEKGGDTSSLAAALLADGKI